MVPAMHERSVVVVVGAGLGGLTAACLLGRAGLDITLLEAAERVGGKAWHTEVGGRPLDLGPSVLTLRGVFDGIFAACGEALEDHVTLQPLPQLARHVWAPGVAGTSMLRPTVLDLYPDAAHSAQAIGEAFGAAAAREYSAFVAYAQRLWHAAAETFVFGAKPSLWAAARQFGARALWAPWEMDARRTMAAALQAYFPRTPALRQLFGRYATYCGGSPYQAPATLNLVAHVERLGVWGVAGGVSALAAALGALAQRQGVHVRTGTPVAALRHEGGRVCGVRLQNGERLAADAVVFAGDARALTDDGGLWRAPEDDARAGRQMSVGLSANVCGLLARAGGPLSPAVHNVAFVGGPEAEFRALFAARQAPDAGAIYVCAPDRAPGAHAHHVDGSTHGVVDDAVAERFFCLRNAPPARQGADPEEQTAWTKQTLEQLGRCGLALHPTAAPRTLRAVDFARRFPGSDGALYGPAPHSWRSFFTRGGSATRWPNVFCAGGTVHPGPGVPMAALSGQFAAEAVLRSWRLPVRWAPAATRGGTSTPKATTAPTSSSPSSLSAAFSRPTTPARSRKGPSPQATTSPST